MSDERVLETLARIDERMENVEVLCRETHTKLFTGNGDSIVTRLRLAEVNIKEMKERRKGKIAMILAVSAGVITMITAIVVAFIGK